MLCEQYRDMLMALLDGELPEAERMAAERHLHTCRECSAEYHRFMKLLHLTHQVHFPTPKESVWQQYWSGVCRKMTGHVAWISWASGAVFLAMVGGLMIFGFSHSALAFILGALALATGACLLGMSYFCNCNKR